jgi:hypothetical protein
VTAVDEVRASLAAETGPLADLRAYYTRVDDELARVNEEARIERDRIWMEEEVPVLRRKYVRPLAPCDSMLPWLYQVWHRAGFYAPCSSSHNGPPSLLCRLSARKIQKVYLRWKEKQDYLRKQKAKKKEG